MKRQNKIYHEFVMNLATCIVLLRAPKYRKVWIGGLIGLALIILVSIGIVQLDKKILSAEARYESLRQTFVTESKIIDDREDSKKGKNTEATNPSVETNSSTSGNEEKDEDSLHAESAVSVEQEEEDIIWYERIDVDLKGLQTINSDIVGWIYFEKANISYPILYSGNNDTYLRTTYEGKHATAGSIFMEEQNNVDFTDKHILIYGHNMRNLTMFGQLRYYKTQKDYYEKHQYFQVIHLDTSTGDIVKERYRIFACKEVTETDDVYRVLSAGYTGLAEFASQIRTGNELTGTEGITVTNEDQIITLSTCSSGDMLFIVSAVKCDTYFVK